MYRAIILYVYILFAAFINYTQAKLEEYTTVTYIKEQINNTCFEHKIEYKNSAKRELFYINGNPVLPNIYQEELLEAEKQEQRQKRQKIAKMRDNIQQLEHKIHIKNARQSLGDTLNALNKEIEKFSDGRLKNYRTFVQAPLESEEAFCLLLKQQVPQAKALLEGNSTDLQILAKVQEQIDKAYSALQDAFLATANNAIEKCDDTALLKELLLLIS